MAVSGLLTCSADIAKTYPHLRTLLRHLHTTYPHFRTLPRHLHTVPGQPVQLERDDLFVLDDLARIEGEGHILRLTRRDDLGLEIVVQMLGGRVQAFHTAVEGKFTCGGEDSVTMKSSRPHDLFSC